MQTFLQLVAQDLYQKIGNDLSRVAIVFPNKYGRLPMSVSANCSGNSPRGNPETLSGWYANSIKSSVKKPAAKKHSMISTSGANYLSVILTMWTKIL